MTTLKIDQRHVVRTSTYKGRAEMYKGSRNTGFTDCASFAGLLTLGVSCVSHRHARLEVQLGFLKVIRGLCRTLLSNRTFVLSLAPGGKLDLRIVNGDVCVDDLSKLLSKTGTARRHGHTHRCDVMLLSFQPRSVSCPCAA
jgi:hypothetical protein